MYSDLTIEEQIHTAVEFLAMGVSIPRELEEALGPEIMLDLMLPEKTE